jgi:hypothetical protein
VEHLCSYLGVRDGGTRFEVTLRGSAANVYLLDVDQYHAYLDEDEFVYYGGFYDFSLFVLDSNERRVVTSHASARSCRTISSTRSIFNSDDWSLLLVATRTYPSGLRPTNVSKAAQRGQKRQSRISGRASSHSRRRGRRPIR